MADVFISYASIDAEAPEQVGRLLERQGYSVWWDRHLVSGEAFSRSIVRELDLAKAVVVLWTPGSVVSDWVYSEARRAHAQGKLVQLRAADVSIDELPAPFDAFHCPPLKDDDALLRGVSSALAGKNPSSRDVSIVRKTQVARIPSSRMPLVGRDDEVDRGRTMLAGGTRLLTLTGSGGAGKTRLAMEIARTSEPDFSDGAVFVPMVSVTTAEAGWTAVAQALGVAEQMNLDRLVTESLEGKRALLVLDNLEQFPGAAQERGRRAGQPRGRARSTAGTALPRGGAGPTRRRTRRRSAARRAAPRSRRRPTHS